VTRWFAVHTQPGAEAKAEAHLRNQGFGTFVPRYARRRSHARRIETVRAPLFPRYLFVELDLDRSPWRSVDGTVGVVSLVRAGDRPAPVPHGVVEELMASAGGNGLVRLPPPPRLAPGQSVRITDGPLCERIGLVDGMTDQGRVALLLDLLGRKVRVVVDRGLVEAAG